MVSENTKIKRRPVRSFPQYSLENSLVIAKAIQEKNAGKPMKKLLVANAINRSPGTNQFRDLLSSSYKYGLTLGTEKADNIELTKLGIQITKPTSQEQASESKQKAILSPPKFNEIYSHFKDSKFQTKGEFFENLLETQFGIPKDYVKEVIQILEKNGKFAKILRDISGSPHIILGDYNQIETKEVVDEEEISREEEAKEEEKPVEEPPNLERKGFDPQKKKKVYITHGKNTDFIEPIKKLLRYGELEPIVSTERPSVSQPVPDKVMNEMRNCGAAIIHVDIEKKLIDQEDKEHSIINPNVLIEIGAAMALYGKRFILLVKEGLELPSNLQGLYEVRYNGENLDGDDTLKLLEAIKVMKEVIHPDEEVKE